MSFDFIQVPDSDVRACQLADRHYSRKTKGSNRMSGPGEHLILIDQAASFIVGFRLVRYRLDNQQGIECFIFRNESQALSSQVLADALPLVVRKWGNTRVFTYVNPSKIKSSNPGCCFKKAGFKTCGTNKTGKLIILEKNI